MNNFKLKLLDKGLIAILNLELFTLKSLMGRLWFFALNLLILYPNILQFHLLLLKLHKQPLFILIHILKLPFQRSHLLLERFLLFFLKILSHFLRLSKQAFLIEDHLLNIRVELLYRYLEHSLKVDLNHFGLVCEFRCGFFELGLVFQDLWVAFCEVFIGAHD